ncbi:hypothetical protein LEL_10990 [Akanthomyces lecanii RCEF 1005]|uniref:Uncharacterized protein n=1 Tax=Akanthomyces lecanii RCEF 1005 TaxID=1081108 RepID=A0A167NF72_CORDF|nr:hypothetical protein LEL_10990 [Akanthomyces lecanii RCEF 1005]
MVPQLQNSSKLDEKVPVIDPISFIAWYHNKTPSPIPSETVFKQLGVSSSQQPSTEPLAYRTWRELLGAQPLAQEPAPDISSAGNENSPRNHPGVAQAAPTFPPYDPVHDATSSPLTSVDTRGAHNDDIGADSHIASAFLAPQFVLQEPTTQTGMPLHVAASAPQTRNLHATPFLDSGCQAESISLTHGQPQADTLSLPAGVVQNPPIENRAPSSADPALGASMQAVIATNASATNQTVPPDATHGLDALANAASLACAPDHDTDSGYGGSAVSSQVSEAALTMPGLCSRQPVSLPRPSLDNQSISLYGQQAVGSNLIASHLPVGDGTTYYTGVVGGQTGPASAEDGFDDPAGQESPVRSSGSDHARSPHRHNPDATSAVLDRNGNPRPLTTENTEFSILDWSFEGRENYHSTVPSPPEMSPRSLEIGPNREEYAVSGLSDDEAASVPKPKRQKTDSGTTMPHLSNGAAGSFSGLGMDFDWIPEEDSIAALPDEWISRCLDERTSVCPTASQAETAELFAGIDISPGSAWTQEIERITQMTEEECRQVMEMYCNPNPGC